MKLIECPRDAMQGIHEFIPTALKAKYINLLLQTGFDTIDFGSFVSPKAIPQLNDTKEVLAQLDLGNTATQLLAIVANLRGAEEAMDFPEIRYVGFPFSISETFQQRNTNSSILQSMTTVEQMLELCDRHGKIAVIYLSMGFGNPYGDEYSSAIVEEWAAALVDKGTKILSLSDTIGVSTPAQINELLPMLTKSFPETEIGLHLHSTPGSRLEKIEAAYHSGCKRFDSALRGFGGCPMAKDDLTGNMATEDVIAYLEQQGEQLHLDHSKLQHALVLSSGIFIA
ncbi:hydroxymethylglutaryl-CoA lyase [Pedobacter sp. MC2016-15]|uniref:hydroxymethylglutaryl-CoA lyase n=1 Tax=Pedobacter sp. MC2016-15 TaxID=2994473 RepID=UPI0022482852|nr:hydroxymethylglutaryl-CoA lyase [Pedobacter sp. MC2016-15]MCX2480142.1 hydroxymethylglutaryl-CoA lyase [Pedobacter sp. MC2016-15]